MTSKQELLDRIKSLSLSLKEAELELNERYGCPKTEARVLTLIGKKRKGVTKSEMSRLVRSFQAMNEESKDKLLEELVFKKMIVSKIMPTLSGRGRPCTKYFLVAADD